MAGSKLPRIRYDAGAGNVDIDFDSVLIGSDEFQQDVKRDDVFGGTGRMQSNFHYLGEILDAKFQNVPAAIKDDVKTFVSAWGSTGGVFTWYPDQTDLGTSFQVQMMNKNPGYNRRHGGVDRWWFHITMRKQIT